MTNKTTFHAIADQLDADGHHGYARALRVNFDAKAELDLAEAPAAVSSFSPGASEAGAVLSASECGLDDVVNELMHRLTECSLPLDPVDLSLNVIVERFPANRSPSVYAYHFLRVPSDIASAPMNIATWIPALDTNSKGKGLMLQQPGGRAWGIPINERQDITGQVVRSLMENYSTFPDFSKASSETDSVHDDLWNNLWAMVRKQGVSATIGILTELKDQPTHATADAPQ